MPFDLKSFLASLPTKPGVYRMLDKDDGILYVGKARHLRNRVSSYFHGRAHADKTMAMVAQVASVEITVTASETEALLLEHNLIKQHKPRYNILLKDDKSFPFIHVSGHAYPRISFYRGTRKLPGRFFGPVSQHRRHARDVAAAAEAVPPAPLRGHVLRQPLATLPAAPDRSLHGAVRRPDHARAVRARRGGTRSRCSTAATSR